MISLLGRQIVLVAVPYQVYLLTGSSLAVGLLGIAQAVPIVVAGLYGGHLADRFDRRRVMIACQALSAVGSLLLIAASVGRGGPLGLIYAATAATAGLSTVEHAARSALLPRLVGLHRLPLALTLNQGLFQLATVAGPALAGLILAAAGLPVAYAIDVACFVLAVAVVWRLEPQPPDTAAGAAGWRSPLEGLRFVAGSQVLIGIFAIDLAAMVFGMPRALFPALATDVFRAGPGGLGLLYAAPSAGALAGALFLGGIGRVRRQGMAVIGAVAVWGLAIAIFGLSQRSFGMALGFLGLAGLADMVSAIFRHTLLQGTAPDALRGRLSAFNSMVITAGPRLGDLEAGAVASLSSVEFSVISGGLASVAGAVLVAVLIPGLRRQRASRLSSEAG